MSIPSKTFEHILFKKLYEHCAEYLHVSQYGFRKNRFPIIQLITFLQKVYNGIESQQEIDILFTDFSKAFDRVDHGILLQKLHDIGVRGNLFEVLKSYLYDSSQRVRIANELSIEIPVTSGVPQGSILSPMLFLIFINDLPGKCEHIIPLLFADDAKFLSVGLSQNMAQKDLDVLLEWTKLNQLPFNMDKCNHMKIGESEKQLKFGDELIQMVSVQSDLGLTISNDLKWNLHIGKACSKAIRVFHMIKRNVSNLNTEAKLNLYKSMVVPVILYGSPCYGMSKYVMSELEKIQRRVVNWIKLGNESYKKSYTLYQFYPYPCTSRSTIFSYFLKMLSGRYASPMLKLPIYSSFSRHNLFQLKRPNRKILEEDYFSQTCRLADSLKIDLLNQIDLKKTLLNLFWRNFENYDERYKCSWRLACDCTLNNCRSKTSISNL